MRALDSCGVPVDAAISIAGLSPFEIEDLVSECPIQINIDPLLQRSPGLPPRVHDRAIDGGRLQQPGTAQDVRPAASGSDPLEIAAR